MVGGITIIITDWSEWSAWSCSVTCGSGTQRRTRRCNGGNCFGPSEQTEPCRREDCAGS